MTVAPTIWLFDDEKNYRDACSQAFNEQNLPLELFATEDALRSAVAAGRSGDVIILDVLAPPGGATNLPRGRTGIRLYRDLKDLVSDAQFLFLTNLTAASVEKDAGGEPPPKVLEKQLYLPEFVAKYVRFTLLQPEWMQLTLERLEGFSDYPANWDEHAAKPVDDQCVMAAYHLLRRVCFPSTPKPHVCATRRGGISIHWDTPTQRTLILEFIDPTQLTVWSQEEDAPPIEKSMKPDDLDLDDFVHRLTKVD